MIFFILTAGTCFCAASIAASAFINMRRRRRYGRISASVFVERYMDKIYLCLSKSRILERIITEFAYKISIFNTLPFEKNKRIGAVVFALCSLIEMLMSVVLVICFLPYWYIALVYIILLAAVLLFTFQLVSDAVMGVYLTKMPQAIKILKSRFISKNNISKAIQASIPDIPAGLKGEMIRIYDALKINETERMKDIFKAIDAKYSDEHMTVLLNLIWIAHYTGGTDSVKRQFDLMLSDVLEDIENKKDLKSAVLRCVGVLVIIMILLIHIMKRVL